MRFGAVTLVSSVAGGLTVLLLAVVLVAMRHISSDMQALRRRVEAEQRRREEIRRKVETPEAPEAQPRHLRLVHKLPPTLFVLSALLWELAKRHPVPSIGLTSAAAGLAASAVFLTPVVRPAMTNPGPATGPTRVVHVPAPGRTTPVRKEAVPVGTHPPEVPTGPPMSPAAATVSPSAPSPTSVRPPQTTAPSPVLPSVLRTAVVTTPRLPLPTVCITVVRIPVCT